MRAVALALLIAALSPALAHADAADDPCTAAVIDPAVTPVRDIELDAQRSACVRQEVFTRVLGHALVDAEGFHGVLGGNLTFGGRLVLRESFEVSAQLRVIDYTYVQNAVNKVTNTAFGPIILGGAATRPFASATRGALAGQLELPYTRDPMDTRHASGQLAALVTTRLAPSWFLHGRAGMLGMYASSLAGSESWFAVRGGSDVVWQFCRCAAVLAGAEVSAGWRGGFDHVLVRAGVHWNMHASDWRLRAGVGAPIGGDERTNAVLDIAIVHGL